MIQVIRIANLLGVEKTYTSFSLDSLSEVRADTDSVYLYFNSLIHSSSFSPTTYYYGTTVKFEKTSLGYQLYGQIILNLSQISNSKIVNLDYTEDPLVTLTFIEISGS